MIFLRDIYYSDVAFFGNQSVVDSIVDNLACMLKVPRYCLHVVSFSKLKTIPAIPHSKKTFLYRLLLIFAYIRCAILVSVVINKSLCRRKTPEMLECLALLHEREPWRVLRLNCIYIVFRVELSYIEGREKQIRSSCMSMMQRTNTAYREGF